MPTGSSSSSHRARLVASVTALVGLSVISGCASRAATTADRASPTVTAPQPIVNQQPTVNTQPIIVQQGATAPSIPLDPSILDEVETVEGDFERIYIPPLPSTN